MPAVPRQGLPEIDDSMKIEHASKPNLHASPPPARCWAPPAPGRQIRACTH